MPSDSTLHRTLRAIDASTLGGLWEAMAEVRVQVWRRAAATTGSAPVVLDIDSSLVEIHSENKQRTGPTYKGGFGFNPMLATADATGEVLAALLRPGNAGTTTVADHLAVLDAAVGQLPKEVAAGHRRGDDASLVRRELRVRSDSAGCSAGFAWGCRERNIGFAVVARSNDQVHAAISRVLADEARWSPALHHDGEEREGAAVAELTDFVDVSGWPPGTRLIVRREPLHAGAQQTLFPSLAYRYWGQYTDATEDPASLDVAMRATPISKTLSAACVTRGSSASPSSISTPIGGGWRLCASPTRWCGGFSCCAAMARLASAEPKTLHWSFWHSPGRLVRSAGR